MAKGNRPTGVASLTKNDRETHDRILKSMTFKLSKNGKTVTDGNGTKQTLEQAYKAVSGSHDFYSGRAKNISFKDFNTEYQRMTRGYKEPWSESEAKREYRSYIQQAKMTSKEAKKAMKQLDAWMKGNKLTKR